MDDEEQTSKLAELFPHSIEITRGQKGQYGWTVKLRFKGEEKDSKAMVKAVSEIDAELRTHLKDEVKA